MSEQLIEAARSGDVERVVQALAAGAQVDSRDATGATALMIAAHGGHLEAVRALLAAGADVNATDAVGWSALVKALYNTELDRGFAAVV